MCPVVPRGGWSLSSNQGHWFQDPTIDVVVLLPDVMPLVRDDVRMLRDQDGQSSSLRTRREIQQDAHTTTRHREGELSTDCPP